MSANLVVGKHNGWRFSVVENKYNRLLRVHLSYPLPEEYVAGDLTTAIQDAKTLIDKLNTQLEKHAQDEKR